MGDAMAGSMTGSVLVVVIVVVAGVLYLLLRRRGARRSEEIRPLPGSASGEASEMRPAGPSGPVAEGLPPKPRSGNRGSSHPGYPVAPAKYSGGVPVKPGQPAAYGATTSRPELDPVAEARKAANAPAPAEPWYPEAPANYAEGEEPGDGRGPV